MKKGHVRLKGGKEYKTVALRVTEFRSMCPATDGWGIVTELVSDEQGALLFRACIMDPELRVVATGHASGNARGEKALEKCETVAVGRALAAFGLGGEEYASADEMRAWMEGKEKPPAKERGASGSNQGERNKRDTPDTPKQRNRITSDVWQSRIEGLGLSRKQVNAWLREKEMGLPHEVDDIVREAMLLEIGKDHIVEEIVRMFPNQGDE